MRRREGFALVTALALLALAGGLLAAATLSSRALVRAARAARLTARADAAAPRALADALAAWDAEDDALAIGAVRDFPVAQSADGDAVPLWQRVQLRRLSADRWMLVALVDAGVVDGPIARRRAMLLLERASAVGGNVPATRPVPVTQWALAAMP